MKIPYALSAAVKVDHRNSQMAHAVQIANTRGYPRLQSVAIDPLQSMSIACYGPSLAETYQDLTRPILSMSGATRFLADRGIVPDFHIDMDPRPYKAKHLDPPIPGVNYLMASVCPPDTWELLKDQHVTLWHTYSGRDSTGRDTYRWVAEYDPGAMVVHGGSTIGLTALHVAGVLGYRHFEIHGMDGSLQNGRRHAGPHFGKPQGGYTWNAEGRTYQTSQIMANAVAETINTVERFPMFCVFHGDGLTQALIREANLRNACTANQVEKAAIIRRSVARIAALPVSDHSAASFWDALIDQLPADAVPELIRFVRQAEALRSRARFNTGSVPLETALQLRALCHVYQPKVVAEVGTFIGVSTYALTASEVLYTCDKDNDCIVPTDNITVHPYTVSTQMFERMLANSLAGKVDLFFFDGRIQAADLPLIRQLSHAQTIYAFDDCSEAPGADKGLANIKTLLPTLDHYGVVPPNGHFAQRSTLGALIPMQVAA